MREADNIFWYLYCLLGKTNRGPRMHARISRNFPVLFNPVLHIVYNPVLRIRIRIILGSLIRIRIKVESLIRIRIKVESLIRIKVNSGIQIRIVVKSGIGSASK